MKKNIIDDGFKAELVKAALFDGIMEIPIIEKPKTIKIPKGMVPFSERHKSNDKEDFIIFYEHDYKFSDKLFVIENYLEDLRNNITRLLFI